jgi:hypothetical protein
MAMMRMSIPRLDLCSMRQGEKYGEKCYAPSWQPSMTALGRINLTVKEKKVCFDKEERRSVLIS